MELKEQDAKNLIAYRKASELPEFVSLIKRLYHSCRDTARDSLEKTGEATVYWTGRADSLERLLDFMSESQKVDLTKFLSKKN
jgi:hypothetical protein